MVDPDRRLGGDLHVAAGHYGRQRGPAVDPGGPRRQLHRPAVGDRRLCADTRRVRFDRRLAGRPAGTQARLRRRPRDLLGRLAALRAGTRPDNAQPRPCPAGDRRRRDVRRLAGADRPGVHSRARARHGDGDLRRHDRGCGGDRAAGRRGAHRLAWLGIDLLRQRAGRDRRLRDHLLEAPREPRSERHPDRLGRGHDVQPLALPAGAGARAGQRRGLGQHADRGTLRRRRDSDGRVHRDRASRLATDASPCPLPPARRSPASSSPRSPSRGRCSRSSST